MTEEFWKEKYYKSLDRQKEIRIGLSIKLAQAELLQTCEDNKEVLEQIKEKSMKYYELLEILTNMVMSTTPKEISIPKIE